MAIVRTLMAVIIVVFCGITFHYYVEQGNVRAEELKPKLPNFEHTNNQTFLDLGMVKNLKSKIKLLAKGEIKTKIKIEVDAASNSAKDFVEKIGGSITVIENKKLAVKPSKKAGV